MTRLLRAAGVIARRDYSATVLSRTFLLFLIGPLLPVIFGVGLVGFGEMTGGGDAAAGPPAIAVSLDAAATAALVAAREHLADRLGDDALPRLKAASGRGDTGLGLTGTLAAPILSGPREVVTRQRGHIVLIVEQARTAALLDHIGVAARPASIAVVYTDRSAAADPAAGRRTVARVGQGALFMLTLFLANMLLWNLVEEKSNKVIEVLAAAVPVRAIFLGKLAAMLAISLTGIAVWTSIAGIAATAFMPAGVALPEPAVGWPAFGLLGVLYFVANYLLFGAVLLGLGAQVGSMREVQSISLPVTMAQLILFGFAGAGLGRPGGAAAIIAAMFPLSSPMAMIARAGETPALWPHLVAFAWQAGWIAVIIVVSAARFRSGVLKSGAPLRRRRFWSRGNKP